MENSNRLNSFLRLLKNFYNYVQECDKTWIQASQHARERGKDLLVLSDQLQCLSRPNKTQLCPVEIQKTIDRIILVLEEKYAPLSLMLECAISFQDELTRLRHIAEMNYIPIENNNILPRLMQNAYVIWLFFQMKSSIVSVALKEVNYKSPESIKQLLESVSESDDFKSKLTENLEIAEYLIRHLEFPGTPL